MPTWPATLPPLPHNWTDDPNGDPKAGGSKLRTAMGNGPPKVRLRNDRAWRSFTISGWVLDGNQRDILQDFGTNELGRFVETFDIPDPHDETATLTVRFVDDPVYRGARGSPTRAGRAFRTGFTLEVTT